MKRNLVTGATGLLGSHIVEQLVERGERVSALVRPSSDTAFLRSLGVELIEGDITNPESLPRAMEGQDIVYHAAAFVGEWGPRKNYQDLIIEGTRHVLDACARVGVGRVLHVSSITVYGHPKIGERWLTEDEPLGQRMWWWDYYCEAKIAAEKICQEYRGPLTIVRPSWFYGPRDRRSLPRVLNALRAGRVSILGRGDNLLNIVYVGDVADGVIRAANTPSAIGRAYNLSHEGELTQREFLDLLTREVGHPPITGSVPYFLAFFGGFMAELIGRAIFLKRAPHYTRYAVGLISRSTHFSIDRARQDLDWFPRTPTAEGLRRSLAWLREQGLL